MLLTSRTLAKRRRLTLQMLSLLLLVAMLQDTPWVVMTQGLFADCTPCSHLTVTLTLKRLGCVENPIVVRSDQILPLRRICARLGIFVLLKVSLQTTLAKLKRLYACIIFETGDTGLFCSMSYLTFM